MTQHARKNFLQNVFYVVTRRKKLDIIRVLNQWYFTHFYAVNFQFITFGVNLTFIKIVCNQI